MRRLLAIGLIIFAVSLLLQVSAIGEMEQITDNNSNYYEKSYSNSKSPLKSLIVKKAAFDAACNTITLTLADLPECEECTAAKVADLKLKKATRDLERINDYLSYETPNPQGLDLKEKSALGIIYRSIRDDAYAISSALDRWRQSEDSLLKNPWVLGAIVVTAIAIPLAIDNEEENCNSADNEDDCELIGCTWFDNQQGLAICTGSDGP